MTSTRQQTEIDETLHGRISTLQGDDAQALATQLYESVLYWRSLYFAEKKRTENAHQQHQQDVHKLFTEAEAMLNKLRQPLSLSSSSSSFAAAAAPTHSSLHPTHPSHLSRRVSFNRDVVMVVSPDVGQCDEKVDNIEEEEEKSVSFASSHEGAPSLPRRLSRSEIGEGKILKQHLDIDELTRIDSNSVTDKPADNTDSSTQ